MPQLKPFPEAAPRYPLRPDFATEAGLLDAIRCLARGDASGEFSPQLRTCLPPNLTVDEYRRIADWINLPDRLAYYETNISSSFSFKRVLAAMFTPGATVFVPRNPMWVDASERMAADLGYADSDLPWSAKPGPQGARPAQVVLHDLALGVACLVPFAGAAEYLAPNLGWNVT